MFEIPSCLLEYQAQLLPKLEQHLKEAPASVERLRAAMAYANLNGGKRLRAALVYATAESLGARLEAVDAAAVAVELVHAYSLIHDDLPAMDDSPLRRGLPSCHMAFDEATAVLAGDALQALAFEVLAKDESIDPAIRLAWMQCLAHASGLQGMAGGQMMDLNYTNTGLAPSLSELKQMHRLKTGALLEASIMMGAQGAGLVDPLILKGLQEYARALGLAYQIQDDILDVTSLEQHLGKPQGRDAELKKMSYPAVVGLEESQQMKDELYQQGGQALQALPLGSFRLQALLEFVVFRQS